MPSLIWCYRGPNSGNFLMVDTQEEADAAEREGWGQDCRNYGYNQLFEAQPPKPLKTKEVKAEEEPSAESAPDKKAYKTRRMKAED